jgi:hypothetical protein
MANRVRSVADSIPGGKDGHDWIGLTAIEASDQRSLFLSDLGEKT